MNHFITNDFVNFVNPLQGTASHRDFSRGNTLPLVARPFGLTHWALQTSESGWQFHPDAHKIQGIRATHQASPWMGDYGHFTVMAQTGSLLPNAGQRSSSYRLEETEIHPHYLSVHLQRYEAQMEMTPTERCSFFRFTFPGKKAARVLLQMFPGEAEITINLEKSQITGFTRANTGGVPENFACYFAAIFSRACESAAPLPGERAGFAAEFGDSAGQVEMKLGTSFISAEQALLNLEQEIGPKRFAEIQAEGAAVWNETLGKIALSGATEAQQRIFYSCLYRTQLFPRLWYEYNDEGQPIHFSPYDGQIHPGVLYSDNGFWDTYRTEYPLLALLQPKRLAEILQGWTNALKEGGWFPQWASPGYRACMVGTHIDAVMADAVVKGVTDFDLKSAFQGLLRHANEPGDEFGNYGRLGIADYLTLGYVTEEQQDHSVARTLDYAYDDWCLAQIAGHLGRTEERNDLLERAMNYQHLYDPEVEFMRARMADGSWREPFEEFAWGGPYVEGGPWQSSWAVPHDPAGLITLMGGAEKFVEKLDRMLTQEPRFEIGAYGVEIHEMTEMAAAHFGQYAQSNQPVHHVLALFAAAGRPDKMQYWVRRVLNELYTPDDLPGDEDNGEMAAWYVLNAIGLFPLCPGHPSYVLGAPLFPSVQIALPNGKELVLEAEGNNDTCFYAKGLEIQGAAHKHLWISHKTVLEGGHWRFQMTAEPMISSSERGVEDLPYSLSTSSLESGCTPQRGGKGVNSTQST